VQKNRYWRCRWHHRNPEAAAKIRQFLIIDNRGVETDGRVSPWTDRLSTKYPIRNKFLHPETELQTF